MPKIERNDDTSNNLQKIGAALILIFIIFFGSSFITSSFPQSVLLDESSIITYNGNILTFQNISTERANITLNGNQKQVESNDIIAMGGRNSVILTGEQTTLGNGITYLNGMLTIPTKLNHVIIFEQSELSTFDDFKEIKLTYQDDFIVLSAMNDDIFEIKTDEYVYNILLPENTFTYITDSNNNAIYKLRHTTDEIKVNLIGHYKEKNFKMEIIK